MHMVGYQWPRDVRVNEAAKRKTRIALRPPKQGLTLNRKEQTLSPNVLHMLEAQKLGELRLRTRAQTAPGLRSQTHPAS
jgi:hypothetical protein